MTGPRTGGTARTPPEGDMISVPHRHRFRRRSHMPGTKAVAAILLSRVASRGPARDSVITARGTRGTTSPPGSPWGAVVRSSTARWDRGRRDRGRLGGARLSRLTGYGVTTAADRHRSRVWPRPRTDGCAHRFGPTTRAGGGGAESAAGVSCLCSGWRRSGVDGSGFGVPSRLRPI